MLLSINSLKKSESWLQGNPSINMYEPHKDTQNARIKILSITKKARTIPRTSTWNHYCM